MSRSKIVLVLIPAALLLAACSSGGTPTTPPPSTTPAAVATTTSAPPPTTPAATSGSLSGTWNGTYSGAYSGTFVLNWVQTGSSLAGHIALSNPVSTLSIHGSDNNGTIQFGTVGSTAITYTGTVSGSSMSGNYQVGGQAGGPWSASQS